MNTEERAYRFLQQHLDKQPVGFPAVRSGADVRFLKHLFTPEEAKLALYMSYELATLEQIAKNAASEFTLEQTEKLLASLSKRGAIREKEKDGVTQWCLMPIVVGMYESQYGNINPQLTADAMEYMKSIEFAKSFLSATPPQMRTIPVNKSISLEHPIANYDQISTIIQNNEGPFVILKCICREEKAANNTPCKMTSRKETCMGFGSIAKTVIKNGHGREITREEALDILQKNQDDGLVLQPGNAQTPEFVCSCCGCCCGMLSMHKMLPHPIDFWTSTYFAKINESTCIKCGKCVSRCQVNGVTQRRKKTLPKVNLTRCIGCGLCVTTCPTKAITLKKRDDMTIPPKDEEALYKQIMSNKKSSWQKFVMLLKIVFRMRQ